MGPRAPDATRASLRDRVLRLLSDLGSLPATDDAPLGLDSLAVVTLHGRLEDELGLRLRAREVTRESFGTLDGLLTLLGRKLEGGAP